MHIVFKLYASLTQYLPREVRADNRLPLELVHLVLVNGVFVPRAERASRVLHEGDVLAIWPPIAGG